VPYYIRGTVTFTQVKVTVPLLRMRTRDLTRLASTSYDVLVIGGGIHGLACAYEAASRGLDVALVEAGDFGAGASFNHQKTAHGGLRALQSLSIRRAREAVRERRALARIAPWFLRPLPFIVGTYRSVTRSRVALRAAFALDGWIGRDRNERVEPELHLPAARLLSRTATLKLFPGVRQDRLTGGAQWYDYQMVENDRLTFAFAAAADRAGADLANHVEALSSLRADGRVTGVRVRDALTGDAFDVQAAVVVNAAGAWVGDVLARLGVTRAFPLVRAMNFVTSKPAADIALAAPDSHGRMLTLVPWRGRAIVGTWQSASVATPSDPDVTAEEIDQFIGEVNHAFPALKLSRQDIRLVHRGLVPAMSRGGSMDLLPAAQVLDHASDGVAGAITVVGAKYTTARAVAERVGTVIGKKLRRSLRPSRTATTVLPGAGIADHEALAIETARRFGHEYPLPLIRHLTGRYAEDAAAIIRLIAERPDTATPVAADTPTVGAEIVHVIRNEAALKLADIVVRRTTLGAAGHPGAAALDTCATIAAGELGWSSTRIREEIADVERVYRVS
jgi:glycerol-3-phosphate dehydrogenase